MHVLTMSRTRIPIEEKVKPLQGKYPPGSNPQVRDHILGGGAGGGGGSGSSSRGDDQRYFQAAPTLVYG